MLKITVRIGCGHCPPCALPPGAPRLFDFQALGFGVDLLLLGEGQGQYAVVLLVYDVLGVHGGTG